MILGKFFFLQKLFLFHISTSETQTFLKFYSFSTQTLDLYLEGKFTFNNDINLYFHSHQTLKLIILKLINKFIKIRTHLVQSMVSSNSNNCSDTTLVYK